MIERNNILIQELRLQHEYLFNLMLRLEKSVSNNLAAETIAGILDELEKYSEYHFGAESNYAKRSNSELSAQHEAEHRQFLSMISELKSLSIDNRLKSSLVTLNFLRTWLREHIHKTDELCLQDIYDIGHG
jgi:hemerythrin-like metal-binding protein